MKTISSYCFSDCNLLEHIELPEGLNYIEEFAFRNSGLISVTIPSSVKVLGMDCFNRCYALKEVAITIGSQLDCVGPFCWSECPSLRTFICEQKTFELLPVNLREFLEKKVFIYRETKRMKLFPFAPILKVIWISLRKNSLVI